MSDKKTNSGAGRHSLLSISLIILASIGVCAGAGIAKAVGDRSDYYHIFIRMDSVLSERSEVTRYYDEMYWRDNDEFLRIVEHMTPSEIVLFLHTVDIWMPNMRSLLEGKGDTAVITADQVDQLTKLLQLFAVRGNPALQNDINREMDRMHISDFIGMTMTQAWGHMHAVWGMSNPPSPVDPEFQNPPTIAIAWTPWFSPTPGPTPPPYSIRTPEATLAGSEFANFWAVYRDPDDGYGFAYPADWVLRSQPDVLGMWKGMMVCNNDSSSNLPENIDRICMEIHETPGIDAALPLDQAVGKEWCEIGGQSECGPISLIPATAGKPAHIEVEIQIKVMLEEPPRDVSLFVFRAPTGKLISLYSYTRAMQTPEAQAMVNSFVFGDDTPIIAPMFDPSKKITVTDTSP